MYTLESKLYYKIKLPFLNTYKDRGMCIDFKLAAMEAFAKENSTKPGYITFDDLKACFDHNDIERRWFDENSGQLLRMHNLIKKLKTCYDAGFYSEAIIFSHGISVNTQLFPNHSALYKSNISRFILDMPTKEVYEESRKAFDNSMFDCFSKYIPSTFSRWPLYVNGSEGSTFETAKYTDFACTLFEFMLQRASFTILNYTKPEHKAASMNIIMCYFKWLKGKKIYLPKNLQEMVFNFPYIN